VANGFNSTFSTQKVIHSNLLVLILFVCGISQGEKLCRMQLFFCLAELALVQPQQGQYRVNITKERCPQLHIRNPSDQEPH
jgi:hypothetical protein